MIARMMMATCIALATATTGMAQDSDDAVGVKRDWTIFDNESPRQCWVVAPPQAGKSTARRNGQSVDVNRGEIYLFVSFWPGAAAAGSQGEVSFKGGYEFAAGEFVKLQVGNQTFELFTEGDMAWATSAEDDAKIAAAMKAGATAVITGISQRTRTVTEDTFSLMGFTAAYEDARQRCSA
ncbi:MAG: invasion associated locus B family protein [Pseudomonadota bacterium]